MGLFMAKQTLCLSWAFELLHSRDKGVANTLIFLVDYTPCFYAGLYFYLSESPDWKVIFYPVFGIGAFGYIIATLILPESPKWQLLQGQEAEAIKTLNYIARINRSKNRIERGTRFVEAAIARDYTQNEGNSIPE